MIQIKLASDIETGNCVNCGVGSEGNMMYDVTFVNGFDGPSTTIKLCKSCLDIFKQTFTEMNVVKCKDCEYSEVTANGIACTKNDPHDLDDYCNRGSRFTDRAGE